MFQTLIVVTIMILAVFWVFKHAYNKLKPPTGSETICGCGCSGCKPSTKNKTGCGV